MLPRYPKTLFCLSLFTLATTAAFSNEPRRAPVPTIMGEWWSIADNPDLGEYTSEKQQPVDFGLWQAADGTWQLWSCIRGTGIPGRFTQRLLFGWEGGSLFDMDWKPTGIRWLARPELGEIEGGMQAPYVLREEGRYYLFYGDWRRICLATSLNGKDFTRALGGDGQPDLFTEDAAEPPGGNTARDPMVIKRGNTYYCYYTSHARVTGRGAAYVRTSLDMRNWSESVTVSRTNPSPERPLYSDECPHVVHLPEAGLFYLFVTQEYGRDAQTTVYASPTPLYFGIDEEQYKVTTLPVAAPEIVHHEGQYYVAALRPGLDGIRIARLAWVARE